MDFQAKSRVSIARNQDYLPGKTASLVNMWKRKIEVDSGV